MTMLFTHSRIHCRYRRHCRRAGAGAPQLGEALSALLCGAGRGIYAGRRVSGDDSGEPALFAALVAGSGACRVIARSICWSTRSLRIFILAKRRTSDEFISSHTGYSVLVGLAAHALFDGVAIGSGFVLSNWLGWLIFLAIFLHKVPEGFTVASVMLASGRSRRAALISAVVLAAATVLGVLVINLLPGWVRDGLPLSAGVAIYVAATDLVPEVNREPGIRMALVFFAGVLMFLLLRLLAPAI